MKKCIQILLICLSCGVTMAADSVKELREQIKQQTEELELMRATVNRLMAAQAAKNPKNMNDLAHERKFVVWPPARIKKDPSNYFFFAWMLCRDGEKGRIEDRRENLKAALKMYKGIKNAAPEWKTALVKARITSTQASIDALKNPG